jgi:DNA-binding FadR family transcriptional regulator
VKSWRGGVVENDKIFKKIKNKSVVQTVVDSLTKVIIAGELKPGDKIPTEMELAEAFGVGRNSIREAIKILVYYGILEIRRAEGTFVCNGFNKVMIDPMVYGVILHQSDDYTNLMELREMMEVGVMKLAIAKYNEEDLKKLHEKLMILKEEIAKGPSNVENAFIADNVFHDTVSEMGHNPIVDRINNVVREMTYKMRYSSLKNMIESGRGEELYKAHETIYKKILNRDTSHLNEDIQRTYFPEESGM